ncbi:histidine kinase CKI1-like [Olea europaea subsp. europaea]|uniref:histidine kinase n=1 Tax=Olea europaea subsp. europaea TaxID=158383 RepID=A0A8S0SCN1_OLEEU|nr:histidine kinase CKI1-like [Olea europaea subsp. europaea]
MFSNYTFSSTRNDTTKYSWYTQAASRETGKLCGESIKLPHYDVINSSWYQEALNGTNGYASIGSQCEISRDSLFLSTTGMNGERVVSLGFSTKSLINFFIEIAFYNGSLYLETKDGNVLTGGIPKTRMILNGNQVLFQLLSPNGDQVGTVGNVKCRADDGTFRASTLSIWEKKYVVNYSPVEIAGVKLLEEEEFNLEQLLEDVVDLYYPVEIKKGIDVVLDTNDISVTKNFSHVRGRGIPKEKQKSVFENYIQDKEIALGQEGTSLGLGIVQSLVRLMGGEIRIVDKETGERGTCFRFNAFLSTCTKASIFGNVRDDDIEVQGAGPFRDICRAVAEFRRDLSNNCCSRVIWLDKPGTNRINFHGLDKDKLPEMDLIISKPLHDSHLKQTIGLLPAFGGIIKGMALRRGENTYNSNKFLTKYNTSAATNKM